MKFSKNYFCILKKSPPLIKGGLGGVFIFFFSIQNTFAYSCPNYFFATDLAKGSTHQDVRVIQEILNLDNRTTVSVSGTGSRGQETTYFGAATRDALKRFQALFIEYIGVADGKFTSRTRTTMNAVCKGNFFTGKGGSPYDLSNNSAPQDKIAPVIAIAGPTAANVSQPFRTYVQGNEPIQTPSLDTLIITNATAGDVRKISSSTYSFLITPNQDAKDKITLQFEADAISDLSGNKNENASNEWEVLITGEQVDPNTATFTLPFIDLPTATTSDCSVVSSVSVYDYSNPCYGRTPMTDPNAQQGGGGGGGGGGGMEQLMQILQGLLKGLTGAGGGMQDGGGNGQVPGTCVCPGPLQGQPTIGLFPLAGPSGRFLMTANPGMGKYTGKLQVAPPGICGQYFSPKTGCVNPLSDSTGMGPVNGIIPAAPIFMWQGK